MGVQVVTSGGNVEVITGKRTVDVEVEKRLAADTWDKMVAAYGIGYCIPPGEVGTTSYYVGDSYWVEQNILSTIRAANDIKPKQSSPDGVTLLHNNMFGNNKRYTDNKGAGQYGWYNLDDPLINDIFPLASYGGYITVSNNNGGARLEIATGNNSTYVYLNEYYYNDIVTWEFEVYIPSTNSEIDNIKTYDGNDVLNDPVLPKDIWTKITMTNRIVGTSGNPLRIYPRVGVDGAPTSNSVGDFIVIRNLKVNGAMVTGEPANGSLNNYVIDHLTGLAYTSIGKTSGAWKTDLDNALGTQYGGNNNKHGYTDWFPLPYFIARSLKDLSLWPTFPNFPKKTGGWVAPGINGNCVTGTTYALNSAIKYVVTNSVGDISVGETGINSSYYVFAARRHFN